MGVQLQIFCRALSAIWLTVKKVGNTMDRGEVVCNIQEMMIFLNKIAITGGVVDS